jgi:hypothetical protein
MAKTARARLDDETEALLKALSRATGQSESELIRMGLESLSEKLARKRRNRIIGLGKFASGVRDLGSNKRRLTGFGKK